MDAYIELLKKSYYKERKKLEEMWIFNQDGKLRFLAAKNEMLNKIKENLSISQILERKDIAEDVRDNLLRDHDKANKIEAHLDEIIEDALKDIEKETKEELKNAQYLPNDYAEYILQLEKVNVLEAELENNRIFTDMAYEEQRDIIEEKNKTGGGE